MYVCMCISNNIIITVALLLYILCRSSNHHHHHHHNMSVADRRRVLAPTTAVPLVYDDEKEIETPLEKNNSTTQQQQQQQLFIKCGLVTNCSGSCYIETGADKVSVAVYGPHPIRSGFTTQARLRVECRMVQSHFDGGGGNDSTAPAGSMSKQEIDLADFIFTSIHPSIRLSQYPKSGIDIFVSIIGGGGLSTASCLSTAVTAASLATVDAGIQLYDIVTSSYLLNNDDDNHTTIVSLMAARNEITGFSGNNTLHIQSGITHASAQRLAVNEYLLQRMMSICHVDPQSGPAFIKPPPQNAPIDDDDDDDI